MFSQSWFIEDYYNVEIGRPESYARNNAYECYIHFLMTPQKNLERARKRGSFICLMHKLIQINAHKFDTLTKANYNLVFLVKQNTRSYNANGNS